VKFQDLWMGLTFRFLFIYVFKVRIDCAAIISKVLLLYDVLALRLFQANIIMQIANSQKMLLKDKQGVRHKDIFYMYGLDFLGS